MDGPTPVIPWPDDPFTLVMGGVITIVSIILLIMIGFWLIAILGIIFCSGFVFYGVYLVRKCILEGSYEDALKFGICWIIITPIIIGIWSIILTSDPVLAQKFYRNCNKQILYKTKSQNGEVLVHLKGGAVMKQDDWKDFLRTAWTREKWRQTRNNPGCGTTACSVEPTVKIRKEDFSMIEIGRGRDASFSPDGTRIAYFYHDESKRNPWKMQTLNDLAAYWNTVDTFIRIYDLKERKIIKEIEYPYSVGGFKFKWSKDSGKIIFYLGALSQNIGICSLDSSRVRWKEIHSSDWDVLNLKHSGIETSEPIKEVNGMEIYEVNGQIYLKISDAVENQRRSEINQIKKSFRKDKSITQPQRLLSNNRIEEKNRQELIVSPKIWHGWVGGQKVTVITSQASGKQRIIYCGPRLTKQQVNNLIAKYGVAKTDRHLKSSRL